MNGGDPSPRRSARWYLSVLMEKQLHLFKKIYLHIHCPFGRGNSHSRHGYKWLIQST